MNDLPPPSTSRLVRKTAYGRTELFLPTTTAIVREVKCMGGMQRYDSASVYHMLPSVHDQATKPVCCWHCCEEIFQKTRLIPLPRMYDTAEKVYHVYGATCSPSCAKAYVLEHTSFDRGQHLNVLVKMLRELYGVTTPIVTAPPRAALIRFGGHFDPKTLPKADCALIHPPFVSYCMLVEERLAAGDAIPSLPESDMVVEEAETLDEPPPPGIYSDFLQKMESGHHIPMSSEDQRHDQPSAAKRKRGNDASSSKPSHSSSSPPDQQQPQPPPPPPTGPMAKFVRSRS